MALKKIRSEPSEPQTILQPCPEASGFLLFFDQAKKKKPTIVRIKTSPQQ